MVRLELSDAAAEQLSILLQQALGDLSMEIADTDNAEYRRMLDERRHSLEEVYRTLSEVATPDSQGH